MTCIVAITDGKRTVMGGDSAASFPDNTEIYDFATGKIFSTGEYLVGVCGSYRSGQVAQYEMEWPEPPEPGADLDRFMACEITGRLLETFKKAAHEPNSKALLLIALRGRLFVTGSDNSAVRLRVPWTAIGSGRLPAYGALHALAGAELSLEDKVRAALAAAQAHTANVREPFHLLSVPPGRAAWHPGRAV